MAPTNNPLVSILIPFKNTADYLSECLQSIRNQTYVHWEVLAVDDRSTDQSRALVADFSEQDARIKVLTNKGQGIISALRTAYAHSSGSFITRMDSDDIMMPKKLEVLARSLQCHGPGHVAVGLVKYFSHRGISNGYDRYEKWLNNLTRNGENYSEIYKECVIPSPCWMVHRTDLDAVRAFEPDRYPEDYDLTFRFYGAQLKCIPCKELLHLWRDYDPRTSRTSEHYAQNYFLHLKLHYFLKLDHRPQRPLVIWGAGNKGKTLAKELVQRGKEFHWVCDNPNKIGKSIYGQKMKPFGALSQIPHAQSIVTVANGEAQKEIVSYYDTLHKSHMRDYFFFC